MPSTTCYLDFSDVVLDERELIVDYDVFPAEPDVGIFSSQIEITDITGLPEGITLTDLSRDQLDTLQACCAEDDGDYEPDYD